MKSPDIRSRLPHILLTLAFLCAPRASMADNVVLNPGFELGDFSYWTVVITDPAFTLVDSTLPRSGAYAATLGEFPSDGLLYQSVPTIPGVLYSFSFWLQHEGGFENHFAASWDSTTLFEFTNDDPGFGYTYLYFTGLLATSSSTEVRFQFENTISYMHLDDVNVNAVPEPATFVHWTIGAALLGVTRLSWLRSRHRARILRFSEKPASGVETVRETSK